MHYYVKYRQAVFSWRAGPGSRAVFSGPLFPKNISQMFLKAFG